VSVPSPAPLPSFAFADAQEDAKEIPVGLTAESAIIAAREGFKGLIALLEDTPTQAG
jgi:hypothetical protein